MSDTRTRAKQDWHPEDIKAAIRKTGITLMELSARHGFSQSACNNALRMRSYRLELVIAQHLGLRPEEIWPSRYSDAGIPLGARTNLKKANRAARAAQRQNGDAA